MRNQILKIKKVNTKIQKSNNQKSKKIIPKSKIKN
jgi:hypothetical protein